MENFGMSRITNVYGTDVATVRKCLRAGILAFCHYSFPGCDRTQSIVAEQTICRESCLESIAMCPKKIYDDLYVYAISLDPRDGKKYRCELQPYRNAGDSPECYFYRVRTNFTTGTVPQWTRSTDCLYLNGSGYHGNISVTASGIRCQSWTEQCPHRHTMNTTYPELNNAENYCRNPQNSGQRPWCFTTDRNKRWEYCDVPKCIPVDGGYSNWSLNGTCNVTCGEGLERWSRECNNPEPKYGGRNCSHLGEPVEYRPCLAKPCPVNGGYGNWTLSTPCDVSCGDGVEIWRRTCNNPEPKYNGRNCSELGISTEFRNCSKTPCPIDGNYSNWTKFSPCSVTCGEGVEIWTRQCDNPPGKYGGNCSSRGAAQENRLCEMEPCPGNDETEFPASRSCLPAKEQPTVWKTRYCHPLKQLDKPFCEHYGIKLGKYVNLSENTQQYWNGQMWEGQLRYERMFQPTAMPPECEHEARYLSCYYMFPSCDYTTSTPIPKKICKESCIRFSRKCGTFVAIWKKAFLVAYPDKKAMINCFGLPSRNAGDSPECVDYDRKESLEREDCLYLSGSGYHGNISVTASGIPCQSWTEQCPHRHTMNKTYLELNNAENYCRNPQNSGQRPWCFTTNRNKRWEYCDVPKCIPVDGGYSNWSLNGTCNVTCGEGLERWSRECNNPEPKYGGRNCSHLGEPVEYRPCLAKPCPVNGGYGRWNLSNECSITCGNGVEIWRRSCDNPTPKNGGENCSVLGNAVEYRICRKQFCPIDGNYGNWSKLSACSVRCGVGYELWHRKCDNPPPKYGGNCSKHGEAKESRPCRMKPCPVTSTSTKLVGIVCGVCALIFIVAIGLLISKKKSWFARCRRREPFDPYAIFSFDRTAANCPRVSNDDPAGEHLYEEITDYTNL